MSGDGGVGDAGGGGAHEDFHRGVFLPDGLRKGGLHVVSHFRRGEGEAVVTVDRAFDAAGPGEGFFRPEEDGFNL